MPFIILSEKLKLTWNAITLQRNFWVQFGQEIRTIHVKIFVMLFLGVLFFKLPNYHFFKKSAKMDVFPSS